MNDRVERELVDVAQAWDRAMVTNDPESIGSFMADDWIIIGSDGRVSGKARFLERISNVFVRQEGRWKCVLTHLSAISE